MASVERKREEEFLKKKSLFRRNAFLIITKMVELSSHTHSPLVDEVLHSIFFLGEINNPKFSPAEIVSDDNMLNELKGCYPRPFECYASQLPRRSPLSCVLDMIVLLTGAGREDDIIQSLNQLILRLKENNANELISSTICVSQPDKQPNSPRYYGLSMSTHGRIPGRVVIAAACFSNWDGYVADAVMTYYPVKRKKNYFDGTIKLPDSIRCQAFNISQIKEMLPCRSCANLFGFGECGEQEWDYGNCAEAESVSNLLKYQNAVKMGTRQPSASCTEENREKAKESVLKELKNYLHLRRFQWDNSYYTPTLSEKGKTLK